MLRYSITNHRGFSLLEVVITLAITIVGLVGLGTLQIQANRATSDTGNRSQAVWMTQDLINRIRANSESAINYDTGGQAVSCEAVPAQKCASHHAGGANSVAAANCNGVALAAFDLWDVACGTLADIDTDIRSSAADFIANPELTVTVAANSQVTVDLSWDVRTSGLDGDGNAVYASDANTIQTSRANLNTVFYP